jgi:DNA polymerase-4
MIRKIIHLDLDAFFCAVEEQRNPSLVGKPFVVGGRPEERGVVASCSYAARRFGIHSAMPMAHAIRICTQLIIIPARHKAYSQVSKQVMEHLNQLTPLVEQVSIDEAFLDVRDLPEPAEILAHRLQDTINNEPGMPCSLGVATNKLVAKIATNVGKASARGAGPPNAITIVPPGQEAAFLAPLPVDALWGVGPKTAARLAMLNIQTIGELAKFPAIELIHLFGKPGNELSQHAQGIDERPIITYHEAKSISQETTFIHDVYDIEKLHNTLHSLSEDVGKHLRQKGRSGTTIKIKLRWPDFTTLTRQTTLSLPIDEDDQIYNSALNLFEKVWQKGKGVRLIGVGVSGLYPRVRQLTLWDSIPEGNKEKERQLQSALDTLRHRFGDRVIQPASSIKRNG